jgi:hypothetical protein
VLWQLAFQQLYSSLESIMPAFQRRCASAASASLALVRVSALCSTGEVAGSGLVATVPRFGPTAIFPARQY